MKRRQLALAGISAALLTAACWAWAGSAGEGGVRLAAWPLFALCGALAFCVQWLAFVPARIFRTERYFDLTGGATYVLLASLALFFATRAAGEVAPRALLIAALVIIWALRLGSFLFRRVLRAGQDRRFNAIKPYFSTFLMTWTLQGLWVYVTFGAGLAAITNASAAQRPLDVFAALGALLWLAGFVLEIIADAQKTRFNAAPANRDEFITSGLWAWARHPNYFGEIVLWFGVALIALPALQGWQHITLLSPLFVVLQLTKISGVRMLDARARKRWGENPRYAEYVKTTPMLIPRPPKRRS